MIIIGVITMVNQIVPSPISDPFQSTNSGLNISGSGSLSRPGSGLYGFEGSVNGPRVSASTDGNVQNVAQQAIRSATSSPSGDSGFFSESELASPVNEPRVSAFASKLNQPISDLVNEIKETAANKLQTITQEVVNTETSYLDNLSRFQKLCEMVLENAASDPEATDAETQAISNMSKSIDKALTMSKEAQETFQKFTAEGKDPADIAVNILLRITDDLGGSKADFIEGMIAGDQLTKLQKEQGESRIPKNSTTPLNRSKLSKLTANMFQRFIANNPETLKTIKLKDGEDWGNIAFGGPMLMMQRPLKYPTFTERYQNAVNSFCNPLDQLKTRIEGELESLLKDSGPKLDSAKITLIQTLIKKLVEVENLKKAEPKDSPRASTDIALLKAALNDLCKEINEGVRRSQDSNTKRPSLKQRIGSMFSNSKKKQ